MENWLEQRERDRYLFDFIIYYYFGIEPPDTI